MYRVVAINRLEIWEKSERRENPTRSRMVKLFTSHLMFDAKCSHFIINQFNNIKIALIALSYKQKIFPIHEHLLVL